MLERKFGTLLDQLLALAWFPRDVGNTSSTKTREYAICFHGDEGRGLKKGNAAVISVESVLGLGKYPFEHSEMPQQPPCNCSLDLPYANRFCLNAGRSIPPSEPHASEMQLLNLKQRSFLTKFVLGILPNKYYKKTDILSRLLEQLVGDLNDSTMGY